jgi:hypothetical protein
MRARRIQRIVRSGIATHTGKIRNSLYYQCNAQRVNSPPATLDTPQHSSNQCALSHVITNSRRHFLIAFFAIKSGTMV